MRIITSPTNPPSWAEMSSCSRLPASCLFTHFQKRDGGPWRDGTLICYKDAWGEWGISAQLLERLPDYSITSTRSILKTRKNCMRWCILIRGEGPSDCFRLRATYPVHKHACLLSPLKHLQMSVSFGIRTCGILLHPVAFFTLRLSGALHTPSITFVRNASYENHTPQYPNVPQQAAITSPRHFNFGPWHEIFTFLGPSSSQVWRGGPLLS